MKKVYLLVMRGRSKSDPHLILKDVVCVYKSLNRAKRALKVSRVECSPSLLVDYYYSIEMHYVY